MKVKIIISLSLVLILSLENISSQTISDFTPSKDNTIYSENNNSNGLGDLFSGRTGTNNGNNYRRALIEFDITSIPSGSTITSVSLNVKVNKVSFAGDETHTYNIYQVTTEWGEGGSSGGGIGGVAIYPDATWNDATLGTTFWTAAGGDFMPTPLSTINISGVGTYSFTSTTNFVSAVQNWLDNNSSNNGIILIGDENSPNSARLFRSKEAPNSSDAPLLSVTWEAPLSIDDLELNKQITISPNPSNSKITVNFETDINKATIEIKNLLGQNILKKEITYNNTSINIDFLSKGLYLASINYNNKTTVKRFIKN